MENNFRFEISPDKQDERLDNYIASMFPEVSRASIQKLIKNEKIKVNKKSVKTSYKLKVNDITEGFIEPDNEIKLLPENIELKIEYEDDDIIVVNKPVDMLTHPSAIEFSNTLVNALLHHTKGKLSDINGHLRPGIVHRLDRNTSGLLMVAKNNAAHEFLSTQIKEKTAVRKYLAVVKGSLKNDFGIIEKDIGRHPKQPHKMAIIKGGKPSVTQYQVLERFKNATYLELTLLTGRTHQIRVHMSSIGHPIFNDSLYGAGKSKVNTAEQVLQAYQLSFKSLKGEQIDVKIEPDEDITKVLNYLRAKSN